MREFASCLIVYGHQVRTIKYHDIFALKDPAW